jgi:hypothetical protein
MRRLQLAACLTLCAALAHGATPPRAVMVVCAPGYPGNTADAQPTMDALASATAAAAGLPAGRLTAVYYETAAAGLRRLADPDAVLAVVPLALHVQFGAASGLTPFLQAETAGGHEEIWSLVARKGSVGSAAGLADWEITGRAGYAPGFVRDILLGEWGAVPASARVTFTDRPLAALRRAAAGEPVVVLLDREQADSLASLPFAGDLEVVARSRPLPGVVVCRIGQRLGDEELGKIQQALLELHRGPAGNDVLGNMRLKRFRPLDRPALQEILDDLHGAGAGN